MYVNEFPLSVFVWTGEYATCARVFFFANGGGKISVFKHNRIRVDGAWVRVAWNCIVGLFCEAF